MQIRLLYLCALCAVASSWDINFGDLIKSGDPFGEFKKLTGTNYSNLAEEATRRVNFLGNLKKIEGLLKTSGDQFQLGITKFVDWSPEEIRKLFMGLDKVEKKDVKVIAQQMAKRAANRLMRKRETLPASLDWRTTGHVGPVRDQGRCGSCWSFATIASIEAQYSKVKGSAKNFSEQHLMNCDKNSYACQGGLTRMALRFSKDNGNALLSSAPYKGRQEKCGKYQNLPAVSGTEEWIDSIEDMMKFLNEHGPLVTQIYVPESLNYYTGGYYDVDPSTCTEDNNVGAHAMTFVGYGSEKGKDYWIVRNSWGKNWGEAGYIKWPRGSDRCSIETFGVHGPIIKK